MHLPEPVTMRPAEARDRATLVGFLLELNRFEAGIQDDRRLDRDGAELCYEEMLARNAVHGGGVLIAEIEGQAAGFICWRIEEDEPYVRADLIRHAEIAELYVDEAFRRRGLARALLAEAERMIRAAGLPRCFIGVLDGNDMAASAYRQAGFSPYVRLLVKDLR